MEIQQLQIMQEPSLFNENRNFKMFCSCLSSLLIWFQYLNYAVLCIAQLFSILTNQCSIQDLSTMQKIGTNWSYYNDASSVNNVNVRTIHTIICLWHFCLGHASNKCIQSLNSKFPYISYIGTITPDSTNKSRII
jgi:hypothetical protein